MILSALVVDIVVVRSTQPSELDDGFVHSVKERGKKNSLDVKNKGSQ